MPLYLPWGCANVFDCNDPVAGSVIRLQCSYSPGGSFSPRIYSESVIIKLKKGNN